MLKPRAVAIVLALLSAALLPGQGAAAPDQTQRAARWNELQTAIFGARTVQAADGLIAMETPDRALDAAYVPITLTMPQKDKVAAVYLFVDDNPSPYAAHFTFGPAADPSQIRLKVRVDSYTDIHAVVETKDGALHQTSRYVKASGGCSAPAGVTPEEASKGMGEMSLKLPAAIRTSAPVEGVLTIRHPNFNGMQMDQATRGYTPARFIREVKVSSGGQSIFTLNADISLSSDPVISFRFMPQNAPIEVSALDSQDGRWARSFVTAPAGR